MGGYRILHFIIFCLGSVPESLPSALAWEELQLSTNNQLHLRQNAARYEPHIIQITELFPLMYRKTIKFSLHCIRWWVGQVTRSHKRVHQDPTTISKTWHPVFLLLIFSSIFSFLPFPLYIFCGSYLFIFQSLLASFCFLNFLLKMNKREKVFSVFPYENLMDKICFFHVGLIALLFLFSMQLTL